MENQKPYLGMLFVKLIDAGMLMFSKWAIADGMNPLVFLVYRRAIAAVFLAPFAYFRERKEAPHLHGVLLCKIFFTTLCGITPGSALYYVALWYTSATFAAASTNFIPAITFIMAVLLRIERPPMRELVGLAKVLGSVVCVAGALMAAFYQGPPVSVMVAGHTSGHREPPLPAAARNTSRMEWVIGCLLMLTANTAWSLWLILEGALVPEYPVLCLSALQCLFSGLQSFVFAVSLDRRPSSWRLGWDTRLLSVLYGGVIQTGIANWLRGWCVEKKGPVFTTAFNPVAFLMTAAFSALLWNELPFWGCIGGAFLMVGGLYMMLWGKSREESQTSTEGKSQLEAKEKDQVERVTAHV